MKDKSFVVLGLGRFGSTVAKVLAENGYNVIAVDKDDEALAAMPEAVKTVKGDCANLEVLRKIGVDECDVGVVAMSSSLDSAILAIMNLKDLGVKYIVSKAKNKREKDVLEAVGANKVIQPEHDVAVKTAQEIMSDNLLGIIEIDEDYSVIEFTCPSSWVGKTIEELGLRGNYGVNVIGYKSGGDPKLLPNVGPKHVIVENETLVTFLETEIVADVLNKVKHS